jgi:restriction endonuclease S subunit
LSGSTRDKLTKAGACQIEIPLPSLEEQRRIAAILNKADSIKNHISKRQELMDAMIGSMLASDFGSPAEWQFKWEMQKLGDCCECLDRYRKPVKESERKEGSIPYYGANGQQGWIDDFLFDESLVLVAEDGGHFSDRERGVAYRIDGKSWVNNHAHILRPRSSALDIEFLHRVLRHYDFVPFISGSTRSKLTQGQLNEVPIPIPPADKQRSFAERVDKVVLGLNKASRSLRGADSLLHSLSQSIFKE